MTEIDAKAKMKERMAKMRAAKSQKGATPKTKPPAGKQFKTSSTAEVGPIHVPTDENGFPRQDAENAEAAEPRQKVWQVANMADITTIPEEHLAYFLHSMRIEVIKAIRAKKKISYFMFNERHALETHFKAEDVFE